jgi:hypothetical protein
MIGQPIEILEPLEPGVTLVEKPFTERALLDHIRTVLDTFDSPDQAP